MFDNAFRIIAMIGKGKILLRDFTQFSVFVTGVTFKTSVFHSQTLQRLQRNFCKVIHAKP